MSKHIKIDDHEYYAQVPRDLAMMLKTTTEFRVWIIACADSPKFGHSVAGLARKLRCGEPQVRKALTRMAEVGLAYHRQNEATAKGRVSDWRFFWPPLEVDPELGTDPRIEAMQQGEATRGSEPPVAPMHGWLGATGGEPIGMEAIRMAEPPISREVDLEKVSRESTPATPDARGSAEGSLAREERAGAAGDAQADPAPLDDPTEPASAPSDPGTPLDVVQAPQGAAKAKDGASLADPTDSDLPAEWQNFLAKIDDHLATQLLPVLDCYWDLLVASGKDRYPDQLSAILSELVMLVQDRRVDQVIAGIEWTFGGSGCNFPHKAGALREYMTTRSDPNMVHRLAQEPNASEARQRVLQAQSPRPRPTRALPAALAPSATEAAEKRERLAAMRLRAGGTAQPVSAPDASDAQPVAEATPYVETRSPELMARLQATLYRASA